MANVALAAYCHSKPRVNKPNTLPFQDGEPRLIKTVKNGKLFQIGNNQTNTTTHIVHVWGSFYEMGYAHGQLLKEDLLKFMNELWNYIEEQLKGALPDWIPDWLAKDIAKFGAAAALDLTHFLTNRYTTKGYLQEIRGIANATGYDYKTIRRIHLIGELTRGHCSMFGAWGNATQGGKTIQLRALDWDFSGPYYKYPAIVVYHPNPGDGNEWANIGFMGWLGSISGISKKQLAISEIGVAYPDDTFGSESRFGNPFTYVLRDILQFDNSLEEAIHRLKTIRRTCNLIFGVGDGKAQTFRGFQLSNTVCNVIDDTNLLPANDTWHPKINNTVYWAMDWLCDSWSIRLKDLLNYYHGQINGEIAARYIVPQLTSGNLQVVVYDLTNLEIWFSYGYRTEDSSTKIDAYDRPYLHLDMKKIFNETRPTA